MWIVCLCSLLWDGAAEDVQTQMMAVIGENNNFHRTIMVIVIVVAAAAAAFAWICCSSQQQTHIRGAEKGYCTKQAELCSVHNGPNNPRIPCCTRIRDK